MENVVDVIERFDNAITGESVDISIIRQAERILRVQFADEYIDYLVHYGVVAVNGHELTGICKSERINVVEVTLYERNKRNNVKSDWYVIEQANIDGIVIWQTTSGEIYQTAPGKQAVLISGSLREYIEFM